MRHHAWNEADHPRDQRGRFGHGTGGDLGGSFHPAGYGTSRGMPSIVSTADITLSSGDDLSLDRHADGGLTVYNGHSSVTLDRNGAHDFSTGLQYVGSGTSNEFWVSQDEGNVALLRREDDNTISLRLAPKKNPTLDDLRNAPAVPLNKKDLNSLEDASLRLDGSHRVDTGNGDLDTYVTDDNKFAFRHLGEDGRPVEAKFDEPSFARLNRAINVVSEGFDELEHFYQGETADHVTRVDIPTNLGTVRVEQFGEWHGNNPPADRLEIMPEHGNWGIVIDGPQQEAFDDAMSDVQLVGETLQVYDRDAGRKQDRLSF